MRESINQPIIAPLLAGNILGSPNDSFVIAEWQDAGGPTEPLRFIAPRHVHHRDDEAWYVLEGILRVQSGENEIEAHAGSAVLVPRGGPPRLTNLKRDCNFPRPQGFHECNKDLRGSSDAIPIVFTLKAAISKVFRFTRHLSRYWSFLGF